MRDAWLIAFTLPTTTQDTEADAVAVPTCSSAKRRGLADEHACFGEDAEERGTRTLAANVGT